MKLTNVLTLTTVKAVLTRTAMAAVVAGAAFLAAPTQANAQVAWGVRVGPVAIARRPVYIAPVPVHVAPAYGYYGQRVVYGPRFEDRRFHDWDRHDRRYYR
jgi:hypothetical protein